MSKSERQYEIFTLNGEVHIKHLPTGFSTVWTTDMMHNPGYLASSLDRFLNKKVPSAL